MHFVFRSRLSLTTHKLKNQRIAKKRRGEEIRTVDVDSRWGKKKKSRKKVFGKTGEKGPVPSSGGDVNVPVDEADQGSYWRGP